MTAIRLLFVVAALYDGILGLLFLIAPNSVFTNFEIEPPNHLGYIQFPALLLVMFGVMFAQIARSPLGCRSLIPYGIWLKFSYCSVTFWYWAQTDIPWVWKPFAVLDALMLVLFALAYRAIGR